MRRGGVTRQARPTAVERNRPGVILWKSIQNADIMGGAPQSGHMLIICKDNEVRQVLDIKMLVGLLASRISRCLY